MYCHSDIRSSGRISSSSVLIGVFPLELQPVSILLRLAPIVPPPLLFLVSLHTTSQLNVNSGWCREAETLRKLHQVQLVDIEDTAK